MGTLLQTEGKEGVPPLLPVADLEGEMLWETSKHEESEKVTKEEKGKKIECKGLGKGLKPGAIGSWVDDDSSPLAMFFNQEKGWVTKPLGSKSGHWKHLARNLKTPQV